MATISVPVAPSARLAGWLAERHYLPRNVPLLKHVVAKAGQRVCRIGMHSYNHTRPPLGRYSVK